MTTAALNATAFIAPLRRPAPIASRRRPRVRAASDRGAVYTVVGKLERPPSAATSLTARVLHWGKRLAPLRAWLTALRQRLGVGVLGPGGLNGTAVQANGAVTTPLDTGNAVGAASQQERDQLVAELERLGAVRAATRVRAGVWRGTLPSRTEWQESLPLLELQGFTGALLDRLLLRSRLALQRRYAQRVGVILRDWAEHAQIDPSKARQILALRPQVIRAWRPREGQLAATVTALRSVGLRDGRDFTRIVRQHPGALLTPVEHIQALQSFCMADPPHGCAFAAARSSFGSFVRRAPWILSRNVERDLQPRLRFLCDWVGAYPPRPIEKIVRAFPAIFLCPPERLEEACAFLQTEVGLEKREHVATVLRTYPRCVALPLEQQMRRVVHYLQQLGLDRVAVAKCVRGFPSLLALDVEAQAAPVVSFLQQNGIHEVSRVVRSFPPILYMDLERELRPKLEFVKYRLGLNPRVLLHFPSLLSYSLEERIAPRLLYLMRKGVNLRHLNMRCVIGHSEELFCAEVAEVEPSVYGPFRERVAFLVRRDVYQRIV